MDLILARRIRRVRLRGIIAMPIIINKEFNLANKSQQQNEHKIDTKIVSAE